MRLIAMRLVSAIPTLLGVVLITFVMTRLLPGDPAAYFAGPAATADSIEQMRHQLGLDRPLIEQFGLYRPAASPTAISVTSLTSGQTVLDDLRNRLPASLELTFYALLLAIGIGIPLGIGAALRPGGWVDRICSFVSTARPGDADFLPRPAAGLRLLLRARLGAGAARPARHHLFARRHEITGFWTIDTLLAGDWRDLPARSPRSSSCRWSRWRSSASARSPASPAPA